MRSLYTRQAGRRRTDGQTDSHTVERALRAYVRRPASRPGMSAYGRSAGRRRRRSSRRDAVAAGCTGDEARRLGVRVGHGAVAKLRRRRPLQAAARPKRGTVARRSGHRRSRACAFVASRLPTATFPSPQPSSGPTCVSLRPGAPPPPRLCAVAGSGQRVGRGVSKARVSPLRLTLAHPNSFPAPTPPGRDWDYWGISRQTSVNHKQRYLQY